MRQSEIFHLWPHSMRGVNSNFLSTLSNTFSSLYHTKLIDRSQGPSVADWSLSSPQNWEHPHESLHMCLVMNLPTALASSSTPNHLKLCSSIRPSWVPK
jgi:hypothetical protein